MYNNYVYIRKDRNLLRGMWRSGVWLSKQGYEVKNEDDKENNYKYVPNLGLNFASMWNCSRRGAGITWQLACEKTDISRHHHQFPYKMTPEERYERRNSILMTRNYPDLVELLIGWSNFFSINQKHYSILGSNATLVWSFSVLWLIYGRYIRANEYSRRIFPLEFFKFFLSLKTIKHSS